MANHSELALDQAFWNAISTHRNFFDWFLARSKFAGGWLDLDRSKKWHQLWKVLPETGSACETDITLFLLETRLSQKFAIHIENKPAHGKWQPRQAESYEVRAAYRMNEYGHDDYQTALIAPAAFLSSQADDAVKFGFSVSYEDLSTFVPDFKVDDVRMAV